LAAGVRPSLSKTALAKHSGIEKKRHKHPGAQPAINVRLEQFLHLLHTFIAPLPVFSSVPQRYNGHEALLLGRDQYQPPHKSIAHLWRVWFRETDCFLEFFSLSRTGHKFYSLRVELPC